MYSSVAGYAQKHPVLFETLRGEDGFSPTSIFALYQDQNGFLWIGTADGLYCYDGYEFKVFRKDLLDPSSLSDNFITSITGDSLGGIWVGTLKHGLNRLSPRNGTFDHYLNNGPSEAQEIRSLYQDSKGRIWVGTKEGLFLLASMGAKFIQFKYQEQQSDSLSNNQVRAIFEDGKGRLWFGTNDGVNLLVDEEKGSFQRFDTKIDGRNGLTNNSVICIFEDKKGNLWVGTQEGLNIWNPATQKFTPASSIFPHLPDADKLEVRSILEDDQGDLWLGAANGLIRWVEEDHSFQHYQSDPFDQNSLTQGRITCLLLDHSNVLWIGTFGGGLSKVSRSKQQFNLSRHHPANPTSLEHNSVRMIYEDRRGMIWIGIESGVNLMDRKTGRIYRKPLSLSGKITFNHTVEAILNDSQDDFWFGTNTSGLFHYRPSNGELQRRSLIEDSDVQQQIYALLESQDNKIWIGSNLGLFSYVQEGSGFSFERLLDETLDSPVVYVIYEDFEGSLWVGTRNHGVFYQVKENDKKFLNIRSDQEKNLRLSHNMASCFAQLVPETMWVGTYGGGLNELTLDVISGDIIGSRFISERDGLPSNAVCGLGSDGNADLWLSTNNGIVRYNINTGDIRSYDIRDGLQNNEFNQGSFHQTRDGTLFFGGEQGLNYFNPDAIGSSDYMPPVVLTDFQKFNKSVYPKTQLLTGVRHVELAHKDSVISFQFAALDFNEPEKNQYNYLLEDSHQSWIPMKNNRLVTLTNLDPGSYKLRVRATNSDGIWSDKEFSMSLRVKPPIYRTWWAYTFYMLSLLMLGTTWQRRREQIFQREIDLREQQLLDEKLVADRLKRVDKLKDQILANTSHELRTPLNGMIGLAKSMLDGVTGPMAEDQRDNLVMIVSSGVRLNNLVNDILDFSKMVNKDLELKLESQDIHAIVSMVLNLSRHMMGERELLLTNAIPKTCPFVHADGDRLQQILYNLVGNAIKFTEEGEVVVRAHTEDRWVWVEVQDTGIGIPESNYQQIFQTFEQGDGSTARKYGGTGLGLAVTKQLVELHGGTIKVSSKVGKGSCFAFSLPISTEPLAEKTMPGLETVSKVSVIHALLDDDDLSRSRDFEAEITGDGIYKILVVDDNPINQKVLVNRLVLERKFTIFRASSGKEALEIVFSEIRPDLILLDIMMPEQDGYEVCKHIRGKFSADELPILLVTAKNQVGDLVEGFDAGANDFLTKPISQEELISRINVHLKMLELHRDLIDSNEKLVNVNRNLDQMVRDRTEELAQRNTELNTLDEIVKLINKEVQLPALLKTILSQGLSLFPRAERASFWLIDAKTEHYKPVTWAGKEPDNLGEVQLHINDLNDRYVRDAVHADEGVYIVRDVQLAKLPPRTRFLPPAKTSMSLPMLVGGKLEGFLIFENDADPLAFDDVDARKLHRLRGHVVSALNKARMLEELTEKNREILKAQQQLVVQAKLASLGALTAGIAHEIRNPLNFINNFSEISISLADELKEYLATKGVSMDARTNEDVQGVLQDLEENASRISHHGRRAEDIVQRMLDHSRTGLGEKQCKDLNTLVEESVSFGFHGVITRYPNLDIYLERDYNKDVGEVEMITNDISRVIINMVENACYALREKKQQLGSGFEPVLSVRTRRTGDWVEIVIRDNGSGIPKTHLDQIFMPFFTTKPTGEGTGLGLSISYEIITQGHNGHLLVDTAEGEFTEFTVRLPV
ncbi:two-component regulator propeller domain-containing protein [Sulfidibacter corallicola]